MENNLSPIEMQRLLQAQMTLNQGGSVEADIAQKLDSFSELLDHFKENNPDGYLDNALGDPNVRGELYENFGIFITAQQYKS